MEGVDNNLALAADVFDQFCSATTLRSILGHFRYLCDLLQIRPTNFNHFYPKLKAKLRSWKAQALWNKFDKRFNHKCYNRGKACSNLRVLVIGAGPCGLRSAIEAQLLGAKVVVVEKRDRITRNNVLHLWPFVIHDLRALGAKKFFGRFCAGAIDHISIRQLQCILLKVSCLLGIEIHEGVGFESLIPPHQDPQTNEMVGWCAATDPADHPVSQYEFNALIGADGKRNTLDGFKRKEFRGKLAIAITANFINRHSEAEARVEEISGVAFIFNQKFFKELTAETGIDLENIVYYKDDTHYFVMTAKKHSLIDKGVILNDCQDTAKLLSPENVDKGALMEYAREAADFSTNGQLPCLEFAVNHYGQPDVAMFDFTSMYAAENASRMAEVAGHRLFITLVGDSLLEPFWPTGSGCARGFLSSMDACWALRSWSLGAHPLEVLAERESIYRLLGQTTPENLHRDLQSYTLDPHTRYPNLNIRSVIPIQVRNLFTTDDPEAVDKFLKQPINVHPPVRDEHPKKKRKRECHPETLLHWLKRQVHHYDSVPKVEDVTSSFKSGLALCAIIHRYRPHLIDFSSLKPEEVAKNNQLAFDILEKEGAIPPVMTGEEMAECVIPDRLTMLSYLSQVYEAFRGEIPHIKHPKLEETEDEKHHITHSREPRIRPHLSTAHKISLLGKLTAKTPKKRRSHLGAELLATERKEWLDKMENARAERRTQYAIEEAREYTERSERLAELSRVRLERRERLNEIEKNRTERIIRRQYMRHILNKQLEKSMTMLSTNAKSDEPFEDYSLFVYRMTAPDFKDRVKHLENKLLYPDRENRPLDQLRKAGATDEDFTGRVKDLEAKLRGTHSDKKPKDLLRAIGKIEKSDWNVKQIEKKMEENRMGRGLTAPKSEKVPKWSKQQFEDKFSLVEKKLRAKSNDAGLSEKYSKIDDKMKSLERRIKDGIKLEQGPRGSNKVSAMAAHLATINKQPEPQIMQTGKPAVVGGSGGSEMCHFCNKRVYLMERLSAEGRFFHRGCFRCQYCSTSLRLGNYAFDREGKYGSKFYCVQHFGLQGSIGRRMKDDTKIEILKTPTKTEKSLESELIPVETVDVGTPERAEFENLSDCVEVEEDEWSDRNFLPSATDTEASQDSSSSSSSEGYAEAEDGGLDPEETLRLAQDWTRRYASSHYSNSEDETTDSDTEEEAKKDTSPRQHVSDSGSETEVPSEDEYSSSSSEDENSATEISTDSEFEHDGTTHPIPDIVISETVQVRKGLIEAPRQVQLISRQVNGKITPHSGDLKLELKRIDEPKTATPNNNINNNDRPRPFINPNRGDYFLNRTQSTEGIASKISLELKKKYLLGPSGMPGNIRKSGSAITLDTKFKSLIDQISEQQKLLNPAPVPSPTMQAFLQGADKLKTSPVLLEKKILPLKDFKHICSLGNKEDKKDEEKEVKEEKKEEEEVRSRSPVHETSIVVPEFPRTEQKEIESDSLSSEMSSSEEEESAESEGEGNLVSPPKLEIHNSRGELMEEEVQLDSLNIPDVCQAEPKRPELRDKLDLVPSSETGFAKVITVPSNETNGQVLKQVSTPAELFVTKEEVNSDASSPPSPSLKDDVTLGLTETELSDWARDEDGVVSETFDDLEYNINPQTISYKKHLAPRSRRNARGTAPKIARTEEFDDEFTHVCGKNKPTNLHNVENLEFMDTADESSDEDSGAINKILNRGYIQLVNPEDDDLPTPVVEAVNYCLDTMTESKEDLDSRIGESTDTTATSEPTTIKDSPIEPPAQIVKSDSQDKINQEYEIYVQKMQGKISPFGNVRNSIDVRKSRKINKRSPPDSLESVGAVEAPAITTIEEVIPKQISIPIKKDDVKEEPPPSPQPQPLTPKLGLNSPTTHRKLEQLNQERAKQKDLIHEMVMNRLIAQGKSPTERKQRRSIRTVLRSGDTPPAPVPKERPKSEMFVTPAAPPPIRERAYTVTTARRLAAKTGVVASSLPDIHKACSTPGLPSELTVPNLRGMREQARAKFKMMSDEELGLSPEDKIKKFKLKIQKHLHEAKLPSPTQCEKSEINKKSKEERKRSIIQAVSDFFLKKSPTPPKTPSSHSPTKSVPSVSSKKDKDAPPIPPPPVSYNPSQVVDDSQSEEETQSCTFAGMDSLQRKSKQNRRQVRQAQSKRLRMAQEVQRELEELEVKQKELEAKGVAVEKALRGEETGVSGTESELLGEWLRLMRERSEARSKEKQLVIRGQEIELEHRHARLQAQLSELMAASPEGTKTNEEVALEGRILREMLEIVERRNSLQAQLEAEKERYCEEEKDLEAQMLAKGIQFQQPKQ
nr:F-actin-monooxygenase Mical isoform X3 [Halyomorpha halys]